MSLVSDGRRPHRLEARAAVTEEAGASRWLLPYADMITLLLALFVILFAITSVDRVKMQHLVHDISGGFRHDDSLNLPPSGGTTGVHTGNDTNDPDLARIRSQLNSYVAQNGLSLHVSTHIDRRGLIVTVLSDDAAYASGSADLPPQTKRLLDELVAVLHATDRHVRIEGNTDNVPIRTPLYPTNWELSAARATGVTRYLVETRKLSPLRVSLAGYGEFRPIADNATAANRRRNRRVDIVILNEVATKADETVQP